MKFASLLLFLFFAAHAGEAPVRSNPFTHEFTAPQKECHGPDDCSLDQTCWTPGICIPRFCKKDSDCALYANCYQGVCSYGE
jgi:hypothetical protein